MLMRQFHKLVAKDTMSIELIDITRQGWMKTFRLRARHIKHYFAKLEVEYTIHAAKKLLDESLAKRKTQVDQAALEKRNTGKNGRSLPKASTTFGMQLPLGENLDDWAVNKGERMHWNWLVQSTEKKGSNCSHEFRKRVELVNMLREDLDSEGIPTYVVTEYNKNEGEQTAIKDVHLIDCRDLLDLNAFDPLRVDPATYEVIRAWLKQAAAQDPWRQRLIYKRQIEQRVKEPKLGTWSAVGPVKTSATMALLGQAANEPPESLDDSDDTTEDEAEDEIDFDAESQIIPQVIQDYNQRRRKATVERRAERRAKKEAKRAAARAAEDEIRAAEKAQRDEYEGLWEKDYFARLNELCKPKPAFDQAYKTKLSPNGLRELQLFCPEGGMLEIAPGEWIKFPGISQMDDEEDLYNE